MGSRHGRGRAAASLVLWELELLDHQLGMGGEEGTHAEGSVGEVIDMEGLYCVVLVVECRVVVVVVMAVGRGRPMFEGDGSNMRSHNQPTRARTGKERG